MRRSDLYHQSQDNKQSVLPRALTALLTAACLYLTLSAPSALTHAHAATLEPFSAKNRIENPYCAVPTYATRRVTGPARALLLNGRSPIILLNSNQLNRSDLTEFFLAHECCHHTLGHLKKPRPPAASFNGRSFTKENAKMEADADCCAAKTLTYYGKNKAIRDAKIFMSRFGRMPTGFGYPTGAARLGAIESCRLRAEQEFADRLKKMRRK